MYIRLNLLWALFRRFEIYYQPLKNNFYNNIIFIFFFFRTSNRYRIMLTSRSSQGFPSQRYSQLLVMIYWICWKSCSCMILYSGLMPLKYLYLFIDPVFFWFVFIVLIWLFQKIIIHSLFSHDLPFFLHWQT